MERIIMRCFVRDDIFAREARFAAITCILPVNQRLLIDKFK